MKNATEPAPTAPIDFEEYLRRRAGFTRTSVPEDQRKAAAAAVLAILENYPKPEEVSPRFVASAAAILERYPAEVSKAVASGDIGIAAESAFRPSLAEIAEFAREIAGRFEAYKRALGQLEARKNGEPASDNRRPPANPRDPNQPPEYPKDYFVLEWP